MRKMRASLICLIMLIASFSFLFPCSQVIAAQDRVIEFKFATDFPPFLEHAKLWVTWSKKVEERTNGRVKFKFYWAETLLKAKEIRRGIIRGMAELGYVNTSFDPSAYSLNMVIDLPLIGFTSEEMATSVSDDILEKYPEVKAEYKGTKIMWKYVTVPHKLHTTKKPIRTPEDLRNVKITAMGMSGKIVDALGGSSVSLMPLEMYMGLERGVADGAMMSYAPLHGLRLMKLTKFHNTTVLHYSSMQVIMNLKVWNKLPADIQKIFEELNKETKKINFASSCRQELDAMKKAEEMGHEFIVNTPEEIAAWAKKARPLHDEWIEKNEAKGLPAREIYGEIKRLIAVYSK